MRPEGLGKLIKIIDFIGFRTRDLPVSLLHVNIYMGVSMCNSPLTPYGASIANRREYISTLLKITLFF
jgi:hypothetical protein